MRISNKKRQGICSVKFFSGFCFENEHKLFEDYLIDGDFVVAGFSKGAIEAFEYVYNSNNRTDRLLLFSPAFFQDRDESFKKAQIESFSKNPKIYKKQFFRACNPNRIDISPYISDGSVEELKFLLNYVWDRDRVVELIDRGVMIEVFIGENDKIINPKATLEFFSDIVSSWYIKGVGHILL